MRKLPHHFLLFTFLFVIPLFFCHKQVDITKTKSKELNLAVSVHASSSTIHLLQANAQLKAVSFDWGINGAAVLDGVDNILQFSLKEDYFESPLEIPVGTSIEATFTVQGFNQLMHKLIIEPGDAGDVSVRVKYKVVKNYDEKQTSKEETFFSDQILLHVTTYRNIILYTRPDFLKLPGNYQFWNPLLAPAIVSKSGEKEYEGYIYFPNEYPQFFVCTG